MAVEIGNVRLTELTQVAVRERAHIVRHRVPGLSGDLSQTLGRPSVEIQLEGSFYGQNAGESLAGLRSAYLERQPVDFFAEAVGDGYFAQVLISQLDVSQRAGFLDQFSFSCSLLEYVEPPEPVAADPFGLLDSELLGEAIAFIDDVQNALEAVSSLVDLIANAPDFGDPTSRLPNMLSEFTGLTGGASEGVGALQTIQELL